MKIHARIGPNGANGPDALPNAEEEQKPRSESASMLTDYWAQLAKGMIELKINAMKSLAPSGLSGPNGLNVPPLAVVGGVNGAGNAGLMPGTEVRVKETRTKTKVAIIPSALNGPIGANGHRVLKRAARIHIELAAENVPVEKEAAVKVPSKRATNVWRLIGNLVLRIRFGLSGPNGRNVPRPAAGEKRNGLEFAIKGPEKAVV